MDQNSFVSSFRQVKNHIKNRGSNLIIVLAQNNSPSIVFIDEIDAIGTKRYDSTSSGEREIQRTMLELLNQLDGFDDRGDVKVIMATNRINDLDPALIRPGRMDRKILFETPDQNTKRKIFQIHTSKMNLGDDVSIEEFITAKDEMSGADVKVKEYVIHKIY